MNETFQKLLRDEVGGLSFLIGLAALSVATAGGYLYLRSRRGRQLLPPRRTRAVPWSGAEVIGAWLVFFLGPAVIGQLLVGSGLLDRVYGPDLMAAVRDRASPMHKLAVERVSIWALSFSLPLQVAAVLALLRALSDTRPYQLGLTTHRLGANLGLGVIAWFIFQPTVLALDKLVGLGFQVWTDAPPDTHQLVRIAQDNALPVEWCLIFFTALVVAPLSEELLCRGILQPWAMQSERGASIVMGAALAAALVVHHRDILYPVDPSSSRALLLALLPAGFVLLMVPGFLIVQRRSLPAASIYATALFFASLHSTWPNPVALFVLGLGLGWLAYRTQSLVASMTLHVLFNGVACLGLVIPQETPAPAPAKGKAQTTAPRISLSASTCTAVSGSQ